MIPFRTWYRKSRKANKHEAHRFQSQMLLPLQASINLGAIIQGVVAAIVILGVAIIYFDRLSNISNNLDSLATSVDSIETEIASVQLPEMERTLTKLDFALEQQNERTFHSGDNTIYHTLSQTKYKVGISYVTIHDTARGDFIDPETNEVTQEEYTGPMMVIDIEFDDKINMQALYDHLTSSESLSELENERFGNDIGISVNSPFEIRLHIPTKSTDAVGLFIPEYLSMTDQFLQDIESTKDEVENSIAQELN